MAEQKPDTDFFKRVDEHIALSNEQLKTMEGARVAMSGTFAAARFSAWMCANYDGSGERMKQRKDEAMRIFTEEFRRMFEESYDDYTNNYSRYKAKAL
ncbi:DUF3144 domain-containing protein [Asticcacaulis sp.]|jgi:hypothetical protein|uniref:DUF3144 domain-containing protein n=1 Tax=Asticcacaulis sp. TaxID=1872648 RepID=UPI002CB8882C|nr:DUF3144 domain-containing protein [Asticcacaulis sp.]HTM80809.1 DUF3144 domain-containing protein [Asticcacaulis sp.]